MESGLHSRRGCRLPSNGADYEKASGDKIDYSLIPNAPLRQKEISAIQSGVVPDLMEVADPRFTPLNAWSDNLLDLGDLVEPEKSHYSPTALSCCHHYNSTTKQRGRTPLGVIERRWLPRPSQVNPCPSWPIPMACSQRKIYHKVGWGRSATMPTERPGVTWNSVSTGLAARDQLSFGIERPWASFLDQEAISANR